MPNLSTVDILNSIDTARLKMEIQKYPKLIMDQKGKVRNLRETYNEAEETRAMREAELQSEIASETNPNTGKPMYPNAEARQAELLKRKAADPDYQDAVHAAQRAQQDLNQAQDELDMLFDEFKALGYVLGLAEAEVRLWAMEPRETRREMAEPAGLRKAS